MFTDQFVIYEMSEKSNKVPHVTFQTTFFQSNSNTNITFRAI